MSVLATAMDRFGEAFLTLSPIVNPVGCAIVYSQISAGRPHHQRRILARRISINAGLMLLSATWAGAAILAALGLDLSALYVAGGLAIGAEGWRRLTTSERSRRADSTQNAARIFDGQEFVPLTFPLTTGPGALAAAVELGASRAVAPEQIIAHVAGTSFGILAVALSVWLAYGLSHRFMEAIGPVRARALAQLSALVLLCVGVQLIQRGLRAGLA